MSGRKSRSLKQIKTISRRTRKTIKAQIDKQHEDNKEIIFLTKQLMKKISNEGTLDGEIGPTTGILDLVKKHLNEREEYFNSHEHYRTVVNEKNTEFDTRMQKRRQTAKAKEAEELRKLSSQTSNSNTRRKSGSRRSKMSCSIQG